MTLCVHIPFRRITEVKTVGVVCNNGPSNMMLWRKTHIMRTDLKEGLDGWSRNVGQVDKMIDTYHEDF